MIEHGIITCGEKCIHKMPFQRVRIGNRVQSEFQLLRRKWESFVGIRKHTRSSRVSAENYNLGDFDPDPSPDSAELHLLHITP